MSGFPKGGRPIVPANGYGITGNTGLTPTPAVGLTTATSFIAGNINLTASTPAEITHVALAAGTWLIIGKALIAGTAANANTDIWLGTTSASATGAYDSSSILTLYVAQTNRGTISSIAIVTLASPATVYLNAESDTNMSPGVDSGALVASIAGKSSGIWALRIA